MLYHLLAKLFVSLPGKLYIRMKIIYMFLQVPNHRFPYLRRQSFLGNFSVKHCECCLRFMNDGIQTCLIATCAPTKTNLDR